MTAGVIGFLMCELSINHGLTLRQLANELERACSISVCAQNVNNYLDASLITMKQFHKEPQYMHTVQNKIKRKDFPARL